MNNLIQKFQNVGKIPEYTSILQGAIAEGLPLTANGKSAFVYDLQNLAENNFNKPKFQPSSKRVPLTNTMLYNNNTAEYQGRDGKLYIATRNNGIWYYAPKGSSQYKRMPTNYVTHDGVYFYKNNKSINPTKKRYNWTTRKTSQISSKEQPIISNKSTINKDNTNLNEVNKLIQDTYISKLPYSNIITSKNTVQTPKIHYTRAYKQRVADLGLKDSEAVKAMQRQLGVKDDGIWGNKTEAAYQALQGNINGIDFTNSDLLKPVSKPNYNISTVGTIDERGNITLNNPNTKSIYKYNNFLNLNTLPKFQDSINKPLSQYTFAKKGTKLVSRNPIERFQKGKILPTAPRAEDRYKNGRKDSVAYLGIPMNTGTPVDNTYYGESIKQVSTPNRAKIRQHILFRHSPYNNDTIYTEVPEHTKRLPILPPVNIIPRREISYAKTPEYEILKRRFNTAWNLAK